MGACLGRAKGLQTPRSKTEQSEQLICRKVVSGREAQDQEVVPERTFRHHLGHSRYRALSCSEYLFPRIQDPVSGLGSRLFSDRSYRTLELVVSAALLA